MAEHVTGGGSTSPMDDRPGADDMRSAILASFEELEADQAADAEAEKVNKAKPEVDETEEVEKPDDDRDEKGRFKAKTGYDKDEVEEKPEEKAEEKQEEKAQEKPEAEKVEAKKEDEPVKDPRAPPGHWKQSDKEMYKAAPTEVQDFLLRRHREMEADHTKKTQAIAELKREYEPVDQMFSQYREAMKAQNLTPRKIIEGWAEVEKGLMAGRGPEIIRNLVHHYKMDRAQIAQALGLGQQPAQQEQEQPQADPTAEFLRRIDGLVNQRIAPLQQEIEARRKAEEELRAREQTDKLTRAESDVEKFKSAQDDKGNLLHPYFEEVEQDMADLAQIYVKRGQGIPPLNDLYETAVRANPSTYQARRTAEQRAAEAKRQEEARVKAAAAKKAGSSVTGAPGSSQAPARMRGPERSLREELEEAASEHAA